MRYKEQERHGYQSHRPEIEIKDQFCSDVETSPALNTICCYCEVTNFEVFKDFLMSGLICFINYWQLQSGRIEIFPVQS